MLSQLGLNCNKSGKIEASNRSKLISPSLSLQVMNIMKMELAASGMSEEEILAKAQLLMKAFGKEDTASTAEFKLLSKQKNKALVKAEIPPKDFTAVSISLFSTLGQIRLFTPCP